MAGNGRDRVHADRSSDRVKGGIMHLAELIPGLTLAGLEPDRVCTVVAVVRHAENTVTV